MNIISNKNSHCLSHIKIILSDQINIFLFIHYHITCKLKTIRSHSFDWKSDVFSPWTANRNLLQDNQKMELVAQRVPTGRREWGSQGTGEKERWVKTESQEERGPASCRVNDVLLNSETTVEQYPVPQCLGCMSLIRRKSRLSSGPLSPGSGVCAWEGCGQRG